MLQKLSCPSVASWTSCIWRASYSEQSNRTDNTSVLLARECLEGAACEAGLSESATALSVDLLRRHFVYFVGEAASSVSANSRLWDRICVLRKEGIDGCCLLRIALT